MTESAVVYADPSDETYHFDHWVPMLQRRHIQRGDPVPDAGPNWGLDLAPSPEWMSRAACVGEDPRMFTVPELGYESKGMEKDGGVEVCSTCPVRAQCYDYAKRTNQQGLWGGATYSERVHGDYPNLRTVRHQDGHVIRIYRAGYRYDWELEL